MKKIIIIGMAALLAACGGPTAQLHLSAGRIGCSTKDIVIGDVESTSHSETWSAACRGQVWFCSANDDFREVVCKPQLKPGAPVPTSMLPSSAAPAQPPN